MNQATAPVKTPAIKAGLALVAAGAVAVAVFFWNEARKEIIFLCGNFAPGVSEQSVIRQLDTGDFLRYRVEDTPTGKRIESDSLLTFGRHRCSVTLDSDGVVTAAGVE